mgnify:CR=1 FL=1
MKVPDPRFRIRKSLASGHEILVLGARFNSTGSLVHRFNDAGHARNFCRYLFSQSKAHQPNRLTRRNVVCAYGADGAVGAKPLEDPSAQLRAFMREIFPARDAHEKFCDDGAYIFFVLLGPDGTCVSNLIEKRADGEISFNLALIEMVGGGQADVDAAVGLIKRAGRVFVFDDLEPSEIVWGTDRVIQGMVSERLGGAPVLTVSHRDQTDHSQTYHVHRLLHEPGR